MTAYQDYSKGKATPYIRGNVVTKPKIAPPQPKKKQHVSRQIRENRAREASMNAGMMVFLACATIAMVVICVVYLSLHAQITSQLQEITSLESQVADTKADNDARYNAINESVSLDEVRNRAVNELGMTYVTDSQIITYDAPQEDYISQKEAIPEDVVKSSKADR